MDPVSLLAGSSPCRASLLWISPASPLPCIFALDLSRISTPLSPLYLHVYLTCISQGVAHTPGAMGDEGAGGGYWWGENLAGVTSSPVKLRDMSKLVYSPHVYGPGVYNQPYFIQVTPHEAPRVGSGGLTRMRMRATHAHFAHVAFPFLPPLPPFSASPLPRP